MSSTDNRIGFPGHFWRTIFEQEQLAAHLDQVTVSVDQDSPGSPIHLADYGDLQLKVKRATSMGDGFMSDAYLLRATISGDRTQNDFTAFVKVVPSHNSENWFRN
jgi:hypothetical protein